MQHRWMTCEERQERMREAMDKSYPGWTQESYFCPACQDHHDLISDRPTQLLLGAESPPEIHSRRRRRPHQADGWCVSHKTGSPEVVGRCAYCDKALHVHHDELGHVRSGQAGRGYIEEQCPACGKVNAVQPLYGGQKGIQTSRIEDGALVLQLTLGR